MNLISDPAGRGAALFARAALSALLVLPAAAAAADLAARVRGRRLGGPAHARTVPGRSRDGLVSRPRRGGDGGAHRPEADSRRADLRRIRRSRRPAGAGFVLRRVGPTGLLQSRRGLRRTAGGWRAFRGRPPDPVPGRPRFVPEPEAAARRGSCRRCRPGRRRCRRERLRRDPHLRPLEGPLCRRDARRHRHPAGHRAQRRLLWSRRSPRPTSWSARSCRTRMRTGCARISRAPPDPPPEARRTAGAAAREGSRSSLFLRRPGSEPAAEALFAAVLNFGFTFVFTFVFAFVLTFVFAFVLTLVFAFVLTFGFTFVLTFGVAFGVTFALTFALTFVFDLRLHLRLHLRLRPRLRPRPHLRRRRPRRRSLRRRPRRAGRHRRPPRDLRPPRPRQRRRG